MHDRASSGIRLLIGAALLLSTAGNVGAAATITIVNNDGINEGFNDPTPVAPVGGNPETTLGRQRLYVFQYAANIWGSILTSSVPILVNAQMNPQTCDSVSGVLGSASASGPQRNFANAPFPDTWYKQALANKLAGVDLHASADMNCTFNSAIGQPNCLRQGWYLGVDGNEGTAIELLPVVLHELGHGLGFATLTLAGVENGTPPSPDIYDRFILDKTQGMHWNEMTEAQRGASAQNCNNVVWDGPAVTNASPARLGPKPLLRVNSPGSIAGDYDVGLASFGPALGDPGVTADVILVNDGVGQPANGCEPFLNAAQVNGNIAFVDRGGCPFTVKVKNAQNAGAIGVIVSDSTAGCPAAGMGGADPTITIPSVRLTVEDGNTIKPQLLLGTVNATLRVDPTLDAGADSMGRVLLYFPIPFTTGSSVSHFDVSPFPHVLMEPAINNSLSSDVDLARELMIDIGWFNDLMAAPPGGPAIAADVSLGAPRPNPTRQGSAFTFQIKRPEYVRLSVVDLHGRTVRSLHEGILPPGSHVRVWDGKTDGLDQAPPGVYLVSLRTSQGTSTQRVVLAR